MIDTFFRHNRFDQLVHELRAAGELDEDKYKNLMAFFKKPILFTRVFAFILIAPSLIILLFTSYEFMILDRGDWFGYALNFFVLSGICFLGAYLSKAHKSMMWEYCYLMEYGDKCNGYVLSYGYGGPWPGTACVYSFVDSTGRSHVGKAIVPDSLSECVSISPGDNVEVFYMPSKPKFSVFSFAKMDLFKIKK